MFTGIITDIGTVKSVTRGTGGEWGDTRMDITCAYDTSTIDIGASISHAGACMTVIEKDSGIAKAGFHRAGSYRFWHRAQGFHHRRRCITYGECRFGLDILGQYNPAYRPSDDLGWIAARR